MYGIWRSRRHYAHAARPIPDLVADTLDELYKARDGVPSPGTSHPVVAHLSDSGRWRHLGWWKNAEPPTDRLGKRIDPDIYDQVRYDGKKWGGEEPSPYVHPTHTRYISRH